MFQIIVLPENLDWKSVLISTVLVLNLLQKAFVVRFWQIIGILAWYKSNNVAFGTEVGSKYYNDNMAKFAE